MNDNTEKMVSTRSYIAGVRHMLGWTPKDAAKKCGISEDLYKMIEGGEVTHKNIVKRIQKVFKLSDEQAEELLPENYRPSSPKYDPDRYKAIFTTH